MSLSEHLEKLRHFQRLINYSSIREGAAAMGISQAGLSKSISSLESVLDTQLFIRSREGLVLTKEGHEVLKTTERILGESALLETKLRTLKASSAPKKLRVGMYDSIAVYFFSDLSTYMQTLYPAVVLELTVDSSAALAQGIQLGALDIAIGVNLNKKKNAHLEFIKLFDDHYSFYVAPKHRNSTDALPLLIHSRADDEAAVTVEDHLKNKIRSRKAHRIYNFETLKTLTVQGLGIGVLPTQVAKPLIKKDLLVTTQVPKTKHLFGPHSIGFLATDNLLNEHRDFANDIYRLGERWSKS